MSLGGPSWLRSIFLTLTDFLTSLSAAHDDAVPFEVFMREALYHPEFGYYSANIETVGRRGDFSTSATLLPDLAKAIAGWIQEELNVGGSTDPSSRRVRRHLSEEQPSLIEVGAGDGSLFFNVLRRLQSRVRRSLRYHIVETSPRLEALQREKLAKFKAITWHRDMPAALEAAGHRAIIYSNELVDAFPAAALRWNGNDKHWEEICLSFHPGHGLKETFDPTGGSRFVATAFSTLDTGPFPDGQRVELHSSYRDWLHSWLPALEHGSLLTVDYGDTAEGLYHRRPNGTLRAYFKHQRFDGPPEIYARFGKQDLTADVNFTDLVSWGESCGLETVSCRTQADFAGADAHSDVPEAAFKVLHQRK